MSKRLPGSREEDSWLSEAQLARLVRAEEADTLGSPVPTQVVSNGEYFPMPQTLQQKQVEARVAELAGEAAKRHKASNSRETAAALQKYLQLAPDGFYANDAHALLKEISAAK